MPLSVGNRLGPYEILAPISAGGMGEVYRARDTKLERDVAIKVLPAALAQDPERLARFEREAKVLGDGRLSQERWPAWSPDSSNIAFYTNVDGLQVFHIYLIAPTTSVLTQQTNASTVCSSVVSTFDATPTWSPDGKKIAFSSFRSCTANHVYVMDATTPESGTNVPVDLSIGGPLNDLRPDWAVAVAPCGKRICH